jgi:uncharacterized Zn finger protein (UPF0148 family)
MTLCKKCGSVLTDGAVFCGKCGTRVDQPLKNLCPNCGNELEPGMLFCSRCGTQTGSAAAPVSAVPAAKERAISITRETQFQCMANTYRVTVNGNSLGNIGVGKTLCTTVLSEQATVEIVCTTVMVHAKLRMVLRLGDETRITVKIQWPGSIHASVQGAKILEQSY